MTFTEARKQNPRMRRLQPVGIIQNGSRKVVVECCLCGFTHSYAGNWPKPKHAIEFCAYHNAEKCQQ